MKNIILIFTMLVIILQCKQVSEYSTLTQSQYSLIELQTDYINKLEYKLQVERQKRSKLLESFSYTSISIELLNIYQQGIMPYFIEASDKYEVPLDLLLAIASRESNMGIALSSNGTGDRGYAFGIMQIDRRYHYSFTSKYSPLNHKANIDYAAQFLSELIDMFEGDLNKAIAAYNAGAEGISRATFVGLSPDDITTGKNYGQDVRHRREIIKSILTPAEEHEEFYTHSLMAR